MSGQVFTRTMCAKFYKQSQASNQGAATTYELATSSAGSKTLMDAAIDDDSDVKSNRFDSMQYAGGNGFALRFLLQDANGSTNVDGFTSAFRLWGYCPGNTGAVLLLQLTLTGGTLVRGTTAAPSTDPSASGTALVGNWGYVDTITLTTNNCDAFLRPVATGANGIQDLYIDPRGTRYLFGDWDTDAGSGTTPDDGMCLIRPY